ncbi:MAG: alpha/beta hydrolase [Burkholderiales bacterium]|nr:MAG: alpha/beta hydrolase [Burkholderiales bacterium]
MSGRRVDTSVLLRDGRRLAFAEYGDPAGLPVMLLHGLPGSRLAWGFLPGDPFPPGLRLIAPDRPGYGQSDPRPGRSLGDWADDVAALADRLELGRFGIVGVSGGGPGALACAFRMPDRLTRVGVVAGAAPTDAAGAFEGMSAVNRFFLKLAWRAPLLSALNTRFVAAFVRRNPGRYIDLMQRKVHDVDRAVLAMPGIRDMLVRDFAEALRSGGQGMVDDMAANHGRAWGVRLDRIQTPVVFWYASLDRSMPPAMGRYLAARIPGSAFQLVEDAGHLWPLIHLREVLAAVAKTGARGTASPISELDRNRAAQPDGAQGTEEAQG